MAQIAIIAAFFSFAATSVAGAAGVSPFAEGEKATFLGDSITHGGSYHAFLQLYWDLRHPGSGTRLMNCGVSGDSATGGVSRWSWDVAPQGANRTFVMFGMNDVGRGLYDICRPDESVLAERQRRLDAYAANMAEIARHVRASGQRLVVVTPTPYDEYGTNYNVAAATGCNEKGLSSCAEIGRRLAARNGAELLELYRPLTDFARRQTEYCICSTNDRVHPLDDGHLIIMAEILKAMGEPPEFAGADVDAAGRDVIDIDYRPNALPFPVGDAYRRADAVYPLTDTFNREMLAVRNLPSGRYRLTADGTTLGEFGEEELRAGVNLAILPTPGAKRAMEAWYVALEMREAQRRRRNLVRIEFLAEREGARRDDFDGVCAAMEAKIAKMRSEKSQKTAFYENMLASYRESKSQDAKFAEDEEQNRSRLREIGSAACAYRIRVERVSAPVRIDVAAGESLLSVRDRVRAMSAKEKACGVDIVLADGEYVLPDGMEFTEKDGGASGVSPVVWRAEKRGAVRICGAVRVHPSSFAKVDDPALLARLPEEGRGRVYAADVSAQCPEKIPMLEKAYYGKPRPPFAFMDRCLSEMASYPNRGKWISFKVRVDQGRRIPGKRTCEGFTGGAFVYEDPRFARWDFSKGVWLNGYFTHDWYNWSVKAVSYGVENGTNGVVRIGDDTLMPYGVMSGTWGPKARRFRVINLFEELDEPGEWWLDRERKVLYIVPPDGEMTNATDVRLVFSEKPLVRGKGVSDVRFEGLDFSYAYTRIVQLDNAKGVAFADCRFVGTAGGAVHISGTSNAVSRCEVAQCGTSGISMSGGNRKTITPSGSVVEDCRIHDFGILQRTYAGGVSLNGCGLALRGCEIFNAPHLAVAFEGNELLLESNDVHHVLLETGDAGAFYTGRDWTTQGNVLRYNFVHDIGKGTTDRKSDDAAVSGTNAMGFYFDDCDCGDEIYGNVFMNCPRGIMIGGGREHPVRKNVFINCRLGMSMDCRGLRWKRKGLQSSKSLAALEAKALAIGYTNGVWAAKYPRLANIMNDHPCEPLYNPVEDNIFIDCPSVIDLSEELVYNDNDVAPGILLRMAPIRNNTVIYTKKYENGAKRQRFDPRIASGFRVLCAE